MPRPFRPNKKGKQPTKSLHTPAYERIRSLLRETRYAANLSQEELAARLGREQIYVSRCESGLRRVDLLEWLEIIVACKAKPSDFIETILPMVKLPRGEAEN
jgi:transcriptional regulator with XRE-family HTH domain